MNRYLSFFGNNFYPNGGMGDFISSHDNLKDAKAAVETQDLLKATTSTWGHVYDLVDKEIVYERDN